MKYFLNKKSRGETRENANIGLYAEIAHDVRTPISIIFSSIQLMDSYKESIDSESYKKKAIKQMGIIRQNCFRIMRMTDNLIDLSRHSKGYLQCNKINYDIVKLIKDITLSIQKYIETMEIDISFETKIESKIIACDPDMVERIFLNLISNSLKFVHGKGSINITLFEREENIVITINDTGVGIAEDRLSDIFGLFNQGEDYYNHNEEGSGIGLYIVKGFVEAHEGKVSVKSSIGVGTTFEITFPNKALVQDTDKNNFYLAKRKNTYQEKGISRINIEFSDIYSGTE